MECEGSGQCGPASGQGAVQRVQFVGDAGGAGGLGDRDGAQAEVGGSFGIGLGCRQHGVGELNELVTSVAVQVLRCCRDLLFEDRHCGRGMAAGPVAAG